MAIFSVAAFIGTAGSCGAFGYLVQEKGYAIWYSVFTSNALLVGDGSPGSA